MRKKVGLGTKKIYDFSEKYVIMILKKITFAFGVSAERPDSEEWLRRSSHEGKHHR